MTNDRSYPPPLEVNWKNQRKLSQPPECYSFVNGLGRGQGINQMDFTRQTWEGISTTISKSYIYEKINSISITIYEDETDLLATIELLLLLFV